MTGAMLASALERASERENELGSRADRCECGRAALIVLIDESTGTRVPVCESCLDAGIERAIAAAGRRDRRGRRQGGGQGVVAKKTAGAFRPAMPEIALAALFVAFCTRLRLLFCMSLAPGTMSFAAVVLLAGIKATKGMAS